MRTLEAIRSNRATIVVGIVVVIVLASSWLALFRHTQGDDGDLVALVHDGDGRTFLLPLDQDNRLDITTSYGTNVVVVQDGAIHMEEADCPNGTCLEATPLSSPGGQIICLPHHLWIEVVSAGSEGGQMDVSRAQDHSDGVDLVAR